MSNNIVCFFILLVVLLLSYYYFNTYECNNTNNNNNYSEDFYNNYFYLKNDTPMSNDEEIVCSKDCCSTQWPISDKIQVKDPKINMDEYLPTNLNCSNGINDTGCVCKKKKNYLNYV
jgi:hypothetical protein